MKSRDTDPAHIRSALEILELDGDVIQWLRNCLEISHSDRVGRRELAVTVTSFVISRVSKPNRQ